MAQLALGFGPAASPYTGFIHLGSPIQLNEIIPTLNHIADPYICIDIHMLQGVFLNSTILGSRERWALTWTHKLGGRRPET